MMVLVDTTAWIDFFAARSSPHVAALETLIEQREDICICGIILTEVLEHIAPSVRTCRGSIYRTRNDGRHKCRPYKDLKWDFYTIKLNRTQVFADTRRY